MLVLSKRQGVTFYQVVRVIFYTHGYIRDRIRYYWKDYYYYNIKCRLCICNSNQLHVFICNSHHLHAFGLSNQIKVWLCEESEAPRRNPHRHEKKMQAPYRRVSNQVSWYPSFLTPIKPRCHPDQCQVNIIICPLQPWRSFNKDWKHIRHVVFSYLKRSQVARNLDISVRGNDRAIHTRIL